MYLFFRGNPMFVFRFAALAAATLMLSACGGATYLGKGESFSAGAPEALLILNKSGWPGDLHLRAVDTANNQFVGRDVIIKGNTRQLAGSDESKFTGLYVKRLPAGDYAILKNVTSTQSGNTIYVNHNCFAKGTTAYRLEAGKINYIERGAGAIQVVRQDGEIRMEGSVPPKSTARLRTALASYPELNAEIIEPQVSARIKFEGDDGGFFSGIQCPKGTSFERVSQSDIMEAATSGSSFGPANIEMLRQMLERAARQRKPESQEAEE